MVITKELKEKLLQAGSPEEEKALLGEQATEEETARLWHYHVIVFRILKNLYKWLKNSLSVEPEMLRHDSSTCKIM